MIMSLHIFGNRLKCLLRDKENVFWTMLFPILLAVFFNLALSNVNAGESFQAIKLAVVNNSSFHNDQALQTALDAAAAGEQKLFELTLTSQEQAEQLLTEQKVSAYLLVDEEPVLVVSKTGIRESIIKSFLDSYLQTTAAVNTILQNNPNNPALLFQSAGERQNYLAEVTGSAADPNNILIFFYSLIAMSCFYGGFWGMREVTDIQADISALAARINISPQHKLKAFLSSLTASYLIHFSELILLLLFLRYVLQIDFGAKSGYVVLTTALGSLAGIAYGAFISALVKKSENMKVAILIGTTMFGSFLAGMMIQDIKYLVSQKFPLLAYVNPINLLTDAFYSLYYYDTFSRYFLNITILGGMTIAFCLGTYVIVRRRKYASL
jgi:ABC-2 type transport system permease protein